MKTLTAKELALYLGCEIEYTDSRRGKVYTELKPHALEFPTVWPNLKPILRPLSDMTAEEAEEFALLCMNSKCPPEGYETIESDEIQIEFIKDDGGNMLDADVELYIGVACRCFDGSVLIMKDGRIGICEEDEPSENMIPVHDAYGTVTYLLSKYFDLFGWIEQGLAIDKTKIETSLEYPQLRREDDPAYKSPNGAKPIVSGSGHFANEPICNKNGTGSYCSKCGDATKCPDR